MCSLGSSVAPSAEDQESLKRTEEPCTVGDDVGQRQLRAVGREALPAPANLINAWWINCECSSCQEKLKGLAREGKQEPQRTDSKNFSPK